MAKIILPTCPKIPQIWNQEVLVLAAAKMNLTREFACFCQQSIRLKISS